MRIWRALALFLLLINALLLVVRELQLPSPPSDRSELADAPQARLVPEALSHSVAGRNRCFTLGPLINETQREYAEQRLRPFALQVRVRATEADRDDGWHVMIPVSNSNEAMRVIRRLNEQELQGRIAQSTENSVSLGFFETIGAARNRKARAAQLGFDAEISIHRQLLTQYWLDYRIEAEERSPWRAILRDSPEASHFSIPCFSDGLSDSFSNSRSDSRSNSRSDSRANSPS